MVLPPVVPGYLLLLLLGTQGPLGGIGCRRQFGIVIAFTWKGAVLASAVMAFPLMVQPIRLAFRMIDARLEHAAATLGATPWRVFATITLPLPLPGLIAGSVLCFSRSLGEFGATMAFVGNIPGETRTLPLAIYCLTHVPGGEAGAMRLAVLSIPLAVSALLVSHWISWRAERRLGFADHRTTMLNFDLGYRARRVSELDARTPIGGRRHRHLRAVRLAARAPCWLLIAGLLKPHSGTLRLATTCCATSRSASSCRAWERHFGLVFQDGQLFPHLYVR